MSQSVEMLVRSIQDPGASRIQEELLSTLKGDTQFSLEVPSGIWQLTSLSSQSFQGFKVKYNATILGIAENRVGDGMDLNPENNLTVKPGPNLALHGQSPAQGGRYRLAGAGMKLEDIIIGIIILCVYMWPLALVANSKRSKDNEKTGWLLLTVFLSWIGWVIYQSTVLNREDRAKRNRELAERKHREEEALKRRQEQLAQQQAEAEAQARAEAQAQADAKGQTFPKKPDPNVEDSI